MPRFQCESLESLCLDVITHNFDVFCAAFSSKENNNFLFYMDFIQRRCCTELLPRLFLKKLLKPEHLSIVINKYSKELDFQHILDIDFEAVICRLKEIGNVVQKVSMIGIKPFYNYDSIWFYLSNIQTIELQRTICSDKTVILISDHCPQLKNLNLLNCLKISDKSLMYLSKRMPPLESLNVQGTDVTYKGVASILQSIPSLKKLWFDKVPKALFEVVGLNDTSKDCGKDKRFNLSNIAFLNNYRRPENHLTSMIEVCQSLCPFVEDLTVTEIISEKQLNLCSLFQDLKVVNLQCSLIISHELCINSLLKLRGDKIHSLTLMTFSLSFDVLIKCCPNLENLILEFPSFDSIPSSDLEVNFLHLKNFSLHNGVLVSPENIKSVSNIISSSPNLEEITFRVCEFVNEIYDVLLNYPKNLKILSFSNTAVEAPFLEQVLKTHETLVDLRIDNSGITLDEYDDLMDIIDGMDRNVRVYWADYREAIRELYETDFDVIIRSMKRQIMKL